MRRTVIIIVILTVVFLIIPPIVSKKLLFHTEQIGNKNRCVLIVNHPNIGIGYISRKYQCQQNIQLEEKLNSFAKLSSDLSHFNFIFTLIFFGFLRPFAILTILVTRVYRLYERLINMITKRYKTIK